MAEYGNREIGIVQDALKEIYDELLDGGAVEFRTNLLRNLMQSMETKASWTTHAVAVFDAYQPLEKNFGNLNLETMVNYAFANLEVFEAGLKTHLLETDVLHFDETGMRCEKKLHWVHVASSEMATLYTMHAKRGQEAVNEAGILPKFKYHDGLCPNAEKAQTQLMQFTTNQKNIEEMKVQADILHNTISYFS